MSVFVTFPSFCYRFLNLFLTRQTFSVVHVSDHGLAPKFVALNHVSFYYSSHSFFCYHFTHAHETCCFPLDFSMYFGYQTFLIHHVFYNFRVEVITWNIWSSVFVTSFSISEFIPFLSDLILKCALVMSFVSSFMCRVTCLFYFDFKRAP